MSESYAKSYFRQLGRTAATHTTHAAGNPSWPQWAVKVYREGQLEQRHLEAALPAPAKRAPV